MLKTTQAFVDNWLAPLIERGVFLIPIHGIRSDSPWPDDQACACGSRECTQPGKHPVSKWKDRPQLSSLDARRILDEYLSRTGLFYCNWAFRLGASRLACIDVDRHAGGPDGIGNFSALLAGRGAKDFQNCPADSRGHYFFALPPDADANSWPTKIDLAPGVELLTGNSLVDHYVIGPPSDHRDGKAYRWLPGRDLRTAELLALPSWIVEHANKYAEGNNISVRDRCPQEFPTPITRTLNRDEKNGLYDRARKYMSTISGAVSGQGGHGHTLHAAGVLVNGFALTISEAWPIIAEWNLSCQPPWRDADLRRKLTEAEKLGPPPGKQRGWLVNRERPSPFHDLYAEEEFAFAKNIRPVLVKPAERRACPVDDAPPPATSIFPLILAGATLGGDRLNRFEDLCSPAAAAAARDAAAESQERTTSNRVADELREMRLKRFMCPALRRVLLQHRCKRCSRILYHRCDRWSCEGCGQLFRAQWIETAKLRLTNHPWPADAPRDSRLFYRVDIPRSDWQRIYKRLTRLGANYYRIAPDGPAGFRDFIVITTHEAALRGYAPAPVDAATALDTISNLLHEYYGDRRPISSSHPWAIPKREKTGPPQWRRIGKVDRSVTEYEIAELAEITRCELRERSPPESARFRILRVQDLIHAEDMQQSDVDFMHAVLMGQASVEGWATRDVKTRIVSPGAGAVDAWAPQQGGWAAGRTVDLVAF